MKFVIRLAFLLLFANSALAQTAALLPNAVQQFFDNNGNPLSAGTVTTYIVGTSTLKTTWKNSGETIPNTNPIILDAGGKAVIYGDGNYRQVLHDRFGNLIWDAPTSAFGAGGPTSFGDGLNVGTVLPWTGLTVPVHYAFAYGQELSRTTYVALMNAITIQTSVNCSSGSPILTGLGDTTQIGIDVTVEATCMPAGSFVISKTASTITLNANAVVSTSVSARIFLFGGGNGSTTFNVPDLRGQVVAGRDNMGGIAANILAPPFFVPPGTGTSGGSSNQTLITNNLPAYTPAGTVASTQGAHSHSYTAPNGPTGFATSGAVAGVQSNGSATTGTATPAITSAFTGTAQGGTSLPFQTVQPTLMLNYIIKVLPDVNGTTPLSGDVFGPDSSTADAIARFDSTTGKLIKNSTAILGDGGTLTLNTIAASATQGFNILQSGPTTGTTAGVTVQCQLGGQAYFAYNNICISGEAANVTGSPNPSTVGLAVGMVTGGANSDFNKAALDVSLSHTIASNAAHNRDNVAGGFGFSSSASEGGTDTGAGAKGTGFGSSSACILQAGATNYFACVGSEFAVGIQTGASARLRWGVSSISNTDLQATGIDAAFVVGGTSGGPGWLNGIIFENLNGGIPIATTGCIMCTDGSTNTVGKGFDFSPWTVTGNFITGPGSTFAVTGTGFATSIGLAVNDGTVNARFDPTTLFSAALEVGTISNHNVVFIQNNTLAGYFDTSKAFHLGLQSLSQGTLNFHGITGGIVTIAVQASAGTYNFNLPTTAGTAGQVLISQGGGSSAMTWAAAGGTGTVTSIATTSPITGGTITTTGTIACATCVTSAASLTSNQLVIGSGSQASAVTTTGTGVLTALGINVGSAGAFVTLNGALGSPSSAGTIPAFTLGGDIAGSGNHMNNVIIGNTGPQAAVFTALEADNAVFFKGLTVAAGTPSSICMNAATKEITVNAALTCTVSSETFKHNIKPLSASDQINAIRPVSFVYNDSNRERWGFIAEQLASVDRRLADGWDSDGNPRSIDQNAILAQLVKNAQEMIARLEALEARRK